LSIFDISLTKVCVKRQVILFDDCGVQKHSHVVFGQPFVRRGNNASRSEPSCEFTNDTRVLQLAQDLTRPTDCIFTS
jgi:hypothetical protein